MANNKSKKRPPIKIPDGSLEMLRKRSNEVAQIQREFDLQFRQRVQPIMEGINDLKNAIREMKSIPDEPHKFDLEKGVIDFNIDDPTPPQE